MSSPRSSVVGAVAASAVSILVALRSPDARADASNAVAVGAFREGREALKLGKYDEACAKFRVSEDAEPSSGARLNLGDCALRRKEYVEAELLYRGAALLADGEKRTFAEQRAAAARALAGTLRIAWAARPPPNPIVELDGKRVGAPSEVLVNPGRHTVRVSADGYSKAPLAVDVTSGGVARLDLAELSPSPTIPAPASPAPEAPRSRTPISFVLLGGSAAALAGGIITGLVAKSARDDVDATCAGQKPCAPEVFARADVQSDYDRARTWATISTACFVGAAVTFVAGGALWIATSPSPGGQNVSLGGRF